MEYITIVGKSNDLDTCLEMTSDRFEEWIEEHMNARVLSIESQMFYAEKSYHQVLFIVYRDMNDIPFAVTA